MNSIAELSRFNPALENAPIGKTAAVVDKIAKYKWRPLDRKGEFVEIDKDSLMVDRAYQRDAVYSKVTEIAADFQWRACGVIIVMRRADHRYVVVDGQHRVLAAWRRSDIRKLPCLVFESEDIVDEAQCFIDSNTKRKPVTAHSKFRARLVAGDISAHQIQSVFDEAGLELVQYGNAPMTITCIATCERIARLDHEGFRRVIKFAATLAKADGTNVSDTLLSGLYYLDKNLNDDLESAFIKTRILSVGAVALADAARKMSYRVGSGGSKVWAEGMLEIVNRSQRRKLAFKK